MTLIDTNVLLDLVTNDARWALWSVAQLEAAALRGPLLVNDVIYAELSVRFATIEAIDAVLEEGAINLVATPRAALFLAGKTFQRYRAAGGPRAGVLPDFFIGAHAAVAGATLLSRDAKRYRTYFPRIDLITP
jgi:predicted nucleic acid-binding protein